jgi:hypothetical protein
MGYTAEEWNGEVWPLLTQELDILHCWEQLPITDAANPGLVFAISNAGWTSHLAQLQL